MGYKRRPKTNFVVNYKEIQNSKLLELIQKSILSTVLEIHLKHHKFEYHNILNDDIINSVDISQPTLIKHRNILIERKFLTLHKVRGEKGFVIQYRFNWAKLIKLNFITELEKYQFAPRKKSSKKADKTKTNLKEEANNASILNVRKFILTKI